MACNPPPVMPYELFLLGVGVVFNLLTVVHGLSYQKTVGLLSLS